MRHRPLCKISCHPFLKIFVNLVSSVCGFISTCINVSSLVTEPHYLGEDIIKNVWGVGRVEEDGCCGARVIGKTGQSGVLQKEGEFYLSSYSFPREPVKHKDHKDQ